ncbi:glycogen debranching enzyme family protein [Candidatus Woesearchaeota archaeon]|nr:glycogen debranching enzyme family protein [Candidatus Woesearchaeota archaeon]
MLIFKKEELAYETAKEKEWILSNGLGSYSSSTILGINTRKYHGLLVASVSPPAERMLFIAKADEEIIVNNTKLELSSNKYPGVIHPKGFQYLKQVQFDNTAITWEYAVKYGSIQKKVALIQETNAVLLTYILSMQTEGIFRLKPVINARRIHEMIHSNQRTFQQVSTKHITQIKCRQMPETEIILTSDKATYTQKETWNYNVEYEQEEARGYAFEEDVFVPGAFVFPFKKGISKVNFLFIADTAKKAQHIFDHLYTTEAKQYENILLQEQKRKESLVRTANVWGKFPDEITGLIKASDAFIAKRGAAKTILAGYPWFTDWGRDTFISLPGLCLTTGRFNDAREIFKTDVKYLRRGLLPNYFINQTPYYNSVDTSLWFIYAVYKFLHYTQDDKFVKSYCWKPMQEIIARYIHGTDFNIYMDKDGLITAGDENINLTWMDTKIGDKVITPRHGKAVEVNALWYNALRIMEKISLHFNENPAQYKIVADKVRQSFNIFWNEEEKCLYDVIQGNKKDNSIRPNQIFAVSLPAPLVDKEKERYILKKVTEELYTPSGLRSLSPKDQNYKGFYKGNQANRDQAYHNGTVWSWLFGPYTSAYIKVHNYSQDSRQEMKKRLLKYIQANNKGIGIGTLPEIHDGDFPHNAHGCISQAWTVGEILRVFAEELKQS